ncbi:hypothetical protein PIB30_100959 [Stylosanthes scabra]|uniref:Uncharacterized protein n=1 Tax=Stylosanthes scabra TaxID=79078 RepID=A0ABU6SY19_9FABA|nr:hypothetical protein [Stylosanthes scabra]
MARPEYRYVARGMSAPLFSHSGVAPGGPCRQTIRIAAAHSVSAPEHRRDACSRRSLGPGGVVPGVPPGLVRDVARESSPSISPRPSSRPTAVSVLSGVVRPVGKSGPCGTGGRAGSACAARFPRSSRGHLLNCTRRASDQSAQPERGPCRAGQGTGARAGSGSGAPSSGAPVQEHPVQEPPDQEPPVQEPPVQEPPMHPPEAGPSHGIVHGSLTDWYQSFIGDPQAGPSAQAGSSAQAVAFTPLSFQAPRRVDDTTSSESASHDDLRGSMRPYMSDTSSDAPSDDPPQGRGRRVRRPPACGTGGCLEAPPARRGRRGGLQGE